jgi:mono/diheme cytochrome c family protein
LDSRTRSTRTLALPPLLLLAAVLASAPRTRTTDEVDFSRDVLPVLEASCTNCHGAKKQKAGLRLDSFAALKAGSYAGDYPVVVAGKPDESELWLRLITDDDERMPAEAERLPEGQIGLIERWIAEGAHGPATSPMAADDEVTLVDHWAYRAPLRPAPPPAEGTWARGPLDAFVLARLQAEGLTPSAAADPAVLLRRASLDLTGLPPSIEDVDTFLADKDPGAFERAVDRLLASPHYGEHMARRWLDLARYADSNGYEKDERRTMHLWRDWVIGAFNADMPFDRFTLEQLAGDLLPEATLRQRVATGFHRNTMVNREGGIDPEEFRDDAVTDRVNTTATVWLGTTLACAQCHDHKYDPFSQRDYYELFAFFNSTADDGGELAPQIPVPSAEQTERIAELDAKLEASEAMFAGEWPYADAAQPAWEAESRATLGPPPDWRVLAPSRALSSGGSTLRVLDDGSVLASGEFPDKDTYELVLTPGPGTITALRLEAMSDESLPAGGPGRASHANYILSRVELEVASIAAPGTREPVALVGADADHEQPQFRVAGALDGQDRTGWAVGGGTGETREAVFVLERAVEADAATVLHVTLRFESRRPQHSIGRARLSVADSESTVRALTPPVAGAWRSAGPFTADSFEAALDTEFGPESGAEVDWSERAEWRDGRVHALEPIDYSALYLTRTLECERDRRVTVWLGSDDGFHLWVNGELVRSGDDDRAAADDQDRVPVDLVAGTNTLLFKVVNGNGSTGFFFDLDPRGGESLPPEVLAALFTADEERDERQLALLSDQYRRDETLRGQRITERIEALHKERTDIEANTPTALVMEELAEARETRVHTRGSFLTLGDQVDPDVPNVLHELPADAARDRLALARWLVAPENPLTARVTVNRLWEQLFGAGLVATSDDFGTRGDAPTHPQLLDWLAVEFIEGGWSVKHVLRQIVLSSTYRQSSAVTPALLERDPHNELLARGPRFRVDAETVRDVALSASGLLDATVGGPSVFPYQPDGIWTSTYSGDTWTSDEGVNRWRRGLYTFWRRTAPYPTFLMFDATSREVTCARRSRSNTPLQALALLNDPAFLEAAAALGQRMIDGGASDAERATLGFRLCLAREPHPDELDVLVRLARDERERADDELAAWTIVGNVLLNLDELVTKG